MKSRLIAEISKGKTNLYFDHAPNGFILKVTEKLPTEFLIAGADQNLLPADVKIEKDRNCCFQQTDQQSCCCTVFIQQHGHVKCI